MPRTCPFGAPKEYAELREREPITRVRLPTGRWAWLVTAHDAVRRLFTDPNLSANRVHPGFPALLAGQGGINPAGFLPWMDPPEHTTYRRMVISEFTVRRVQRLRPRIEEIVTTHVDGLLAGPRPIDLVQALSLPVPSLVICDLLGVPYTDREFFQTRARIMVDRNAGGPERLASMTELRTFLRDLVVTKQNEPTDDVLSRLAVKYREAGVEDNEHLAGMALLILVAGHETTANMISLAVTYLLEHPDRLAELRGDPTLIPDAVEEFLRYFSISDHSTNRVALADIEIDGVTIRAGEGVLLSNGAANRDAKIFDDPDEFDAHRDARPHLAFGYGIHQCLGQNLARLELEIVLGTLLERIPDLRLAVPLAELPFKNDTIMYGIHEVPVTW
ncbi:cytochrome P450 [Embleya sp. NPDC020630]|uniref:cytochrome P450 n=1 Tax=Embleya sp. NPDC020630 TaxID=3363979 RepID=UPI0037A02CFC